LIATLSMLTFSITTVSIMALIGQLASVMIFSIISLIATFSITIVSITGLNCDTKHDDI
jgi:hypothetical protein